MAWVLCKLQLHQQAERQGVALHYPGLTAMKAQRAARSGPGAGRDSVAHKQRVRFGVRFQGPSPSYQFPLLRPCILATAPSTHKHTHTHTHNTHTHNTHTHTHTERERTNTHKDN